VTRRLTNFISPEFSVAENASGKRRSTKRARSVEPVGDEGPEIDLAQLGLHGPGFEEVLLDEFAELVGDALLIALDDGGMRDRQSQRPLEQGDDRIPVGKAADRRRLRKRCDEAEHRMQGQQRFRGEEQHERRGKHSCRQPLHAPQLRRANRVGGSGDGEGSGKGHNAFIRKKTLILRSGARAASGRMQARSWPHGSRRRMRASSP
jgi:hypothetical protein